MKLCAELASSLSISLAAARRKVELKAARDGIKDLESRKQIAEHLIEKSRTTSESNQGANLDQLLKALEEEDNFMVED